MSGDRPALVRSVNRVASGWWTILTQIDLRKIDVNQFSIITELLGTPDDDVIQTIASENVRLLILWRPIDISISLNFG